MRITQSMLSNNVLSQIQTSNQKLYKYQQELATGKKITKPSDDPVVATMGIAYRTTVNQVDQYKKNVSTAQTWMDNTSSALDQANQVMQRVRELTVQASNGTNTTQDRQSISDEVGQLKQELVSVANTQVAGNYLFNGSDTGTQPVDPSNLSSVKSKNTPSKPVNLEVSQGIDMQINVNPTQFFNKSLFGDLGKLQSDLATGDSATISGDLTNLDTHMNALSATQADLGARQNRLTLTSNRLDQQQTTATQIMSNNEDADVAKVYTELNTAQSVHQAALSVGAKIMQPTLVDFLK